MVNEDCKLKIADFGLARIYKPSYKSDKVIEMTDYVTTRWYRAPEVIVGWHNYNYHVDNWAVGCIIGEMITRYPLFRGDNSMMQLQILYHILGKPDEEFIKGCKSETFQ